MYLMDASTWLKRAHGPVMRRVVGLIEERQLAICPITRLEVLFGAQGSKWDERNADIDGLEVVDHPDEIFARALVLQRALAHAGLQGRKIPDLVVAVTASSTGSTVLHYDRDFEMIATILPSLDHEWVVPAGTV
jgi:predicted nucleic acid-binding protein